MVIGAQEVAATLSSELSPVMDRGWVRKLLAHALPMMSDFEAFCVDCFFEIHQRFPSAMARQERENILLSCVEATAVFAALVRYAPERVQPMAHALSSGRQPGPSHLPNPYRGLAAFTPEDGGLFFGRRARTQELIAQLCRLHSQSTLARVLTLLGPSGSGKSSLAQAGIVYQLRQDESQAPISFLAVVMRPGGYPFHGLARSLLGAAEQSSSMTPERVDFVARMLAGCSDRPRADGLSRYLEAAGQTRPLLLVIDQAEELFTLCTNVEVRAQFIATVMNAARVPSARLSVLLVLRSDFLVEVERSSPLLSQQIAAANAVITGLNDAELRTAIAEPARATGCPLDEAFIDLLIEQTRKAASRLPLLQFALTQVWNRVQQGEDPALALRDLGGVGGAVARHAEVLFQQQSAYQRSCIRRIFMQLVRVNEARQAVCRRVPLSQMIGHSDTEEEVLGLVRHFSGEQSRLLTIDREDQDKSAERCVEITHEALLEHWERLRGWVENACEAERFHDRASEAARLWEESGRAPGRLWRPPDLTLLRTYHQQHGDCLTKRELAFYRASLGHLRVQLLWDWGRWLLIVLGACFVIATHYLRQGDLLDRARTQLVALWLEQEGRAALASNSHIEALRLLVQALESKSQEKALKYLIAVAVRPLDALAMVVSGQHSQMSSGSYSSDGSRLVIASGDGTARVLSAETGKEVLVLRGHSQYVNSAVFSPDSKYILTASADRTVRLWDAYSGALLRSYLGHTKAVNRAEFDPAGTRIATAGADGLSLIFCRDTGALELRLQGHQSFVNSVTFSPDGRTVLTGSADRTARLWDARSGQELRVFGGHNEYVNGVAISPDGSMAATAGADRQIILWRMDKSDPVLRVNGHSSFVNSVTFSPDGRYLLSASSDGSARLWELQTLQMIQLLEGHSGPVNRAEFDPTGGRIITAANDRTVRVWRTGNSKLIRKILQAEAGFLRGCMSPSGQYVAGVLENGKGEVWDVQNHRQILSLDSCQGEVTAVAFSRADSFLAAGCDDGTVQIWDVRHGQKIRAFVSPASILSLSFAPDHPIVLSGAKDGVVRRWNLEDGRESPPLVRHGDWVNQVDFSLAGNLALTASSDQTIRVFDTTTWTEKKRLEPHIGRIRAAAFSHDGQLLIASGENQTSQIWAVQDWRLVTKLPLQTTVSRQVGISPDGERAFTSSSAQPPCLWDTQSGQRLNCLYDYASTVRSAQFSSDGRQLITFAMDGSVRAWDVQPDLRSAAQLRHQMRCLDPGAPADLGIAEDLAPWSICQP